MADVLCFGNLQFDVLCRTVSALPAPAELRMIDDIGFAMSGNGGTVAGCLARLGISVDLAGYSGADLVGRNFRATLASLGVGTDLLLPHPTAGTGASVVLVAPNGERSILYVNGANALFSLDAVADNWLDGRKVVSLSSVFILPQFTGEAVERLFARAHAHGASTILNSAWDAHGQGLPFLKPALAQTDYFILSHDEGCRLTGEERPERILDSLEDIVRGVVVVTLGADGCLLRADNRTHHSPVVPVEAVDSTGAGDSFVAGFIAGVVTGRAAAHCAQLGCRVASFAVSGPGGYVRVPPLADVDRIGATMRSVPYSIGATQRRPS